jgi:hypothetical protein
VFKICTRDRVQSTERIKESLVRIWESFEVFHIEKKGAMEGFIEIPLVRGSARLRLTPHL